MATQTTDIGELDITDELIAERRAEKPGETPEDMTPWQRPITAFIDVLNLWMGRIICLAIIPLVAVMVTEVFSRGMFALLVSYDLDDLARAVIGVKEPKPPLTLLYTFWSISLRCCCSFTAHWALLVIL